MVVTLGQRYNVGEKPTVMLYTYIIILDRNGAIDPYTILVRAYYGLEHKQSYNIVTGNKEGTIAVATNSRSMIFVTIVSSCVRWCLCVFDRI